MTDYKRWRAEQMRDWRFRFWYAVWWPWYQVTRMRIRLRLWREARRERVAKGPIHDSYVYPFVGHKVGQRVKHRLTRYVGER